MVLLDDLILKKEKHNCDSNSSAIILIPKQKKFKKGFILCFLYKMAKRDDISLRFDFIKPVQISI